MILLQMQMIVIFLLILARWIMIHRLYKITNSPESRAKMRQKPLLTNKRKGTIKGLTHLGG